MEVHVEELKTTYPANTFTYDLTKLTGIIVKDDNSGSGGEIGKDFDLNAVAVAFDGSGVVSPELPAGIGYLFTSLSASEIQAAADELQRMC
jgi:hypothetical protein